MSSELRYTQRMVDEANEMDHPVAGQAIGAVSDTIGRDLMQGMIRRTLDTDVTLYASINPSNIFGKVLQGCAR